MYFNLKPGALSSFRAVPTLNQVKPRSKATNVSADAMCTFIRLQLVFHRLPRHKLEMYFVTSMVLVLI